MQITISALHPAGFPVQIALSAEENDKLSEIMDRLLARGYRPPATEWPRTPDGLPLCPKHQAVMTTQGQELWCRGFPHGDKETDGYGDTLLGLKPRSFVGYACVDNHYVHAHRLCPSPLPSGQGRSTGTH